MNADYPAAPPSTQSPRAAAIALCMLAITLAAACAPSERTYEEQAQQPSLFTDITAESGLHFVHGMPFDGSYYMPESMGSGAALFDYDGDGDLDAYLINTARRGTITHDEPPLKNRLYGQDPGGFADVTDSSGLGDRGYGMGVAVGDIDNDADLDVYVTNVGRDALYENNGVGTFTDISAPAGIRNEAWGASATFLDYDVDGFLDLYVTNYVALDTSVTCPDLAGRLDYCGPPHFAGVADVLYRNNGDGTFADVSAVSGIAAQASRGLGVVSADVDGDGHPDIYVANDGTPNHLWINQRDGTFREAARPMGAGVNDLGRAEAGMGIALGDLDNDADFDLFVTHLRGETNTLYLRTPYGFDDRTLAAGLAGPSLARTGFGTGFFDYDHDGDLDLAVVNGRIARGPSTAGRHGRIGRRTPNPTWCSPTTVREGSAT